MPQYNAHTNFNYYLTQTMVLGKLNLTEVSGKSKIDINRLREIINGDHEPNFLDINRILCAYFNTLFHAKKGKRK